MPELRPEDERKTARRAHLCGGEVPAAREVPYSRPACKIPMGSRRSSSRTPPWDRCGRDAPSPLSSRRPRPRVCCKLPDPCKTRKTGRIIDFALKFAGGFFNKAARIRHLEAALRCAWRGGRTSPNTVRNGSIRGRTGQAPDPSFLGPLIAVLINCVDDDMWAENLERARGPRPFRPGVSGPGVESSKVCTPSPATNRSRTRSCACTRRRQWSRTASFTCAMRRNGSPIFGGG